ncbi:CBS domain-containing protein [uncultured Jannaschia sp.]|uniref:CBS domain-containing protein n=1 Tax=uncultured Jannaschia sp. TaxID=293347 RepID=UPI00261085FF|nr:CBS domain-containing protein [uncultured Jannaschia sp.]
MLVRTLLPKVRDRMRCIDEDAALLEGARLLDDDYDMLVIRDRQGRMIGVLTKSDAVRKMGHCAGASCTAPVAEAMSRAVVCMTPDEQLGNCWQTMKDRGLKNVPVVDPDGMPLGVLNARDVLQSLWEDVRHEEDLLFNYVMNVGYR